MTVTESTVATQDASEAISLFAFVSDPESRQVVERVGGDLGLSATVFRGGAKEAIAKLSSARTPRILMVDLTGAQLPLSDIEELANVCDPGVQLIALGDRNDVGLYRDLIDRGVADYLVKPLSVSLLQACLGRLATAPGDVSRSRTKRARIVAITGSRGGVGATTIAASLAWILAERRRRRCTLLDLDLNSGTIPLYFDIEPSRGLREVLDDPSRLDALVVERIAYRVTERLSVIGCEDDLSPDGANDHVDVVPLINQLALSNHFVLIDIGRGFGRQYIDVVRHASDIITVTDTSIAAMRDCIRLTQSFSRVNPEATLRFVVNSAGMHRAGEIALAEFEKGIGRSVAATVPFDARQVLTSLNSGRPVPEASKACDAALASLADGLCGTARKNVSGVLGRILNWGR